ncbi:M20/M25/M40 family metallo-hydrolase [Micromonospora cathayae]|uniref:M20/M25/M40 family metallo-hydrolase n=1 Tax=Micromonospora cathayae TaxID=3028804 RepID=A0ABY7ZJI3_9ACTN|nr:M20/M25/M40 family metallo-hydrolase [Micromonospora sp. HUAS 3]WDZ83150.1 M20/M25/M40 family metallo-hydrolase [Micromonospora sp. HUAS 3]
MADVDLIRHHARTRTDRHIAQLRQLVEHETPPADTTALTTCADLLETWGTTILRRPAQRITIDGLPHLLWPAPHQQVLLLGHYDTVWPAGTIHDWPFTITGNIATGPGVCDMKAGIVHIFAALELLTDTSTIGVLLTCDEESGSPTSRTLIEQQARRSTAVLVTEPSTETGDLKIARKGGSAYQITIHGRAAHAGVEPHRGINAAIELAHQILAARELATGDTTVTPTILTAGTMSNVVPETATLNLDVRAWTPDELHRVDTHIRATQPHLPGATLTIAGGINRYPLPETVSRPLFDIAQTSAARLGLPPIHGAHANGASDANFTGGLGIPTLDGLGGVGGLPHARGEWVDLSRMPERIALLATMLDHLTTPQPTRTRHAHHRLPA